MTGRSGAGPDLRPYAIAVIAALTLTPSGSGSAGISPWCLTCGDRGLADLLLNVILFAPFGVAIAARRGSARQALLAGLALAAGIELLQIAIPGRAPTARDVAANGFGAWLGACAFVTLRSWALASVGATRRLVYVVLVLATLLVALRWLDTPAQLRSYHWIQWRPLLGVSPRWPGQLVEVALGGTPLAEGRYTPTHPLRDLLDADSTLRLRLVAAGTTSEWMPIVGVVDSWRVHLVLVGQEGDDLLLRIGRRSTYFLLETPQIRFVNALREVPRGKRVSVTVRGIARGRPCLSVDGAERCVGASTPGSVWRLLVPASPRPPDATNPMDAATLALLLLPVGLLVGALPRRRAILLGGAALLALGTWSLALGFAPPGGLEALGAALGVAIGVAATQRLARRDSGNIANDARTD